MKKPKKDSSNSSIPPSQDQNRQPKKNESLRKKSDRKVGGQKGHKGSNLKMVSTPDIIETYKPNQCSQCQSKLSDYASTISEKRQVTDIVLPEKQVAEHQKHQVVCPDCGCVNIGKFPKHIAKGCSYGSTVDALVGYFQTYQYLPYARTQELFSDLFDIQLSCGTLKNKLQSLYAKGLSTYEHIKTEVLKSKCIGSDETGFKINGKKFWAWVWQCDAYTYISTNRSRGYSAILDEFDENDFLKTILLCDRYPAQLKTKTKSKQFCLAHLLRVLKYLSQLYQQDWSKKLTKIILEIYDIKRSQPKYRSKAHKEKVKAIEQSLEELVNESIPIKYKELRTLKEKLKANKSFITTCLHHKEVPADNNSSERAIRNFKVKQKISGGFRSENGAKVYAALRSIVDTAIKQNANVWQTFQNLALN